ncbi:PAS domain-containing protein [Methylobacterium aquaticum]|nr:PAS domain-containing protein [Methylobacterium aquaticum]
MAGAPTGGVSAPDARGDALGLAIAAARARVGPFLTALEHSRQPMLISDPHLPDNPVVFANQAFLTLTGYDACEVLGRNCRFLQGPETDPGALAAIREGLREERVVRVTILNYRRDGSRFWNQLLICPIRDEAGRLVNHFASQVDMSHVHEAEAGRSRLADIERRLSEAQRQLSLTLSSAGIAGTWDWDIQAKLLHVDGRFAALTGLSPAPRPGTVPMSPGPLPASAFFSGIHPLDRLRVRLAVSGILGGAEVFDKEYRLLSPDGSVRWVHARGRCHFGVDGRPARFTGVLVEVTDQKRVEERLRIAQSAGRVGAFEHVPGFATVAASPQFCSLLAWCRPAPWRRAPSTRWWSRATRRCWRPTSATRASCRRSRPGCGCPIPARCAGSPAAARRSATPRPRVCAMSGWSTTSPNRSRPRWPCASSTTPWRRGCARRWPSASGPRSSCASRRRWRRWASSPGASPTTSTTCSPASSARST